MSDLFAGAHITPDQHPVMLALAAHLAEHLGPGWASEDGTFHMALRGPDGQHLVLHRLAGSRTGRIGIQGVLPDSAINKNRPHPHTITVAATRTAEAIAADLRRRLLPDYAPAAAAAHRTQTRAADAAASRRQRAAALADRLGGTVRDGDEYTTYVDLTGSAGQSGTLRLQGDGTSIDAELYRIDATALLALGNTGPAAIAPDADQPSTRP